MSAAGLVHKYARSICLNHFGYERLKENLLPQIEDVVNNSLRSWSSQASIEVKHNASVMVFDFTAKRMFGYDVAKSPEKLSDKFTNLIDSFMTFPLNILGTAYHNCLKDLKKTADMFKDMLMKRRISPDTRRGDFLDQLVKDMDTEKFLTDDFIVHRMFGLLLASFVSISSLLALAFKLLAENPSVLGELTAKHEVILKNRGNLDSSLTWDKYKSMTFTFQVINEILRLGNVAPGMLRKALKDIQFNGYTIPAGWTIMVVPSALQLNQDMFKDPLAFNPCRWKDLDSSTISKHFMPFGGGSRQCAGADYGKVFLATFSSCLGHQI